MDSQEQRSSGTGIGRVLNLSTILIVLTLLATPAAAQTLVAVDDSYGVPFAEPLVVEDPGVMENDTYGGAPAADAGAEVTLLTYPNDGVIDCESDPVAFDLCPDGSFIYTPGSGFTGFDSFTYEVTVGVQTQQATVTLTACTGGPAVFVCWQESAYLAQLGALGGYELIQEGFEDDVAWGVTRDPLTAPSVVSQGVRWETNHLDPPASNELITGPGPARNGLWGLYDPEHGYATGTPTECDINDPPPYCLFKDGFTGTREPGETMLFGAGGYLKGAAQPNLAMYLDGGAQIGLGRLSVGGHQFFGVIDTGGFSSFRIEETDGKVGQERYVFGDDFTLATTTADTTAPQVTLVNSWYDTGDGELTEGEITDAAIYQLLVSFSEPVRDVGATDANSVTNPANYLLVSDGGNGFETASCSGGVAGNDVQVSVDWVAWEASSVMTADLDLNGGVDLPVASYRLLVCGTTSIHDWAGNVLDGDGNGTGGDDFVRNFTVYYPPNDPPTANPQSVSTPEDTALGIILTGSDPNSDPLTFSIVTGPTHGGLSGTPPNVTYTPALNYHGPDSFTFRVWDGTVFSDPAMVSITVTPVNDPPTADDQSVSTAEDTALAITLTGDDVDGDGLTFVLGTGPTHGGLTGTPPDMLYTPDADYHGPDSFTFTATDGVLTSPAATVSITVTPVNDVPLAVDDSAGTDEDTATSIAVLTNDALGDPPTTITAVTQGTNGDVTIDPGATSVSYTPNADYHGPDSFTYTITDVDLQTSTATVSMTVNPINDTPLAVDDSATTDEDVGISIAVLSNDDLGDEPTTITAVIQGTRGAVTIDPGATSVTYTPNLDTNGADSFTYTITDADFETSMATVSITVTPVNDPPVADPQSVSTPQDTAVPIMLTGSDVDLDPLDFAIATPPSHGGLSGTPPNVTYAPTGGYFGPDDFTFTVFDGSVTSQPATVSITVTEVTLPVLTIGNASIVEGDFGPTAVDITITLTPASVSAVSVDYATGGGTATAGSDYTTAAGTANFSAGATTATAPLEVLGDLIDEPDETFGVTLSNPVGADLGTPSTGTVTILDDDPMPDLSGADLVVFEWVGEVLVELSLSSASGYDISVDYTTADGTATAPSDYTAVSGTAFIAAGATSSTVPIEIVSDTNVEPDENFTLELFNPTNAVLLTPFATVTIRDDGSLIFRDGFETGDVSVWSAVVP